MSETTIMAEAMIAGAIERGDAVLWDEDLAFAEALASGECLRCYGTGLGRQTAADAWEPCSCRRGPTSNDTMPAATASASGEARNG
jgi:hypothetical protein